MFTCLRQVTCLDEQAMNKCLDFSFSYQYLHIYSEELHGVLSVEELACFFFLSFNISLVLRCIQNSFSETLPNIRAIHICYLASSSGHCFLFGRMAEMTTLYYLLLGWQASPRK